MSETEARSVGLDEFRRRLRELARAMQDQEPALVVAQKGPLTYAVRIHTADAALEIEIDVGIGRFNNGSVEVDGQKFACRRSELVEGTPFCGIATMLQKRGTDQPVDAVHQMLGHILYKPKRVRRAAGPQPARV